MNDWPEDKVSSSLGLMPAQILSHHINVTEADGYLLSHDAVTCCTMKQTVIMAQSFRKLMVRLSLLIC